MCNRKGKGHGYVPEHASCGDCSVDTSKVRVEILSFRYFKRHMVFEENNENFKNKKLKNYFEVSIVIDIECGNTK
ncbi:hypothetical protein DP143_01600 [Clostridium tetani]|nr:hypothetical protein DP143_01600 [Clostridium tetani]